MTSTPYEMAHGLFKDHETLRQVVAGGTSGLVSAVLVTPLDVVKIRLQNQPRTPGATPRYAGTFATLATIAREEGIRGLFSGLSPSVLAYLPDRIIWFSVYHHSKRFLAAEFRAFLFEALLLTLLMFAFSFFHPDSRPDGNTAVHLIATLAASVACTIAVCPLWVIRTRLMAQSHIPEPHSPHYYSSTSNAFSKIVKYEGFGALYSGLGPSLLGVTHSLIMFPLYERLKLDFKGNFCSANLWNSDESMLLTENGYGLNPDGSLTNSSILIASSIAKCVASLATYPHEVVRTRLQTQKIRILANSDSSAAAITNSRPNSNFASISYSSKLTPNFDQQSVTAIEPKYRGVIQTVKVLIREEGWISLYRGLSTSIIRQVPAGAISLWVYELILKV
ncbi:hypothetical protein HK100_005600 [Physocladia obscura]|uniref:Mitochondrial carrier n=1 Tax=Physocladia obscura TaxID=109957 RepID=A0AAD5SRE8_9FUNG|nr:hypothetical protein HK100_005600 [Physocladia obscura]